jgi:hypothetical protein
MSEHRQTRAEWLQVNRDAWMERADDLSRELNGMQTQRDSARAEAAALRDLLRLARRVIEDPAPFWNPPAGGDDLETLRDAVHEGLPDPSPAVARMLAAVEVAEAELALDHMSKVDKMGKVARVRAAITRYRALSEGGE